MASLVVSLGIPAIALLLAAGFVFAVWCVEAGVSRARNTALAGVGVALWLGAMAALAMSGLLARFDLRPPPMMAWFVSIFVLAFVVARSELGKRLALGLPLWVLVGFQAFRLPLELVMHQAAEEGIMPSVMSYSGYNFDILSGISALLLFPFVRNGRAPLWLVKAWNVLGLTLLAIIASVAGAASPVFRAFGEQQVNSWVTQFPYVWMGVMVAMALFGHLLIVRRLVNATGRSGAAEAAALR